MQTQIGRSRWTKKPGISVVLATAIAGFLLFLSGCTQIPLLSLSLAENVLADSHFALDLFPSFPCFPPSAKRLMHSKTILFTSSLLHRIYKPFIWFFYTSLLFGPFIHFTLPSSFIFSCYNLYFTRRDYLHLCTHWESNTGWFSSWTD